MDSRDKHENDVTQKAMTLDEKKSAAEAWFRDLRDRICARFEGIENAAPESMPPVPNAEAAVNGNHPARSADRASLEQTRVAAQDAPSASHSKFRFTPWTRSEGGGGEMGMMQGAVFEKVGVNISTVTGEFSEAFRREIPGAAEDPRFWASGISLVAHMANPKVPAAHFNTRMIATGAGARLWFGGGGDLNPMVPNDEDTRDFHAAFRAVCDEADGTAAQASQNGPEFPRDARSADRASLEPMRVAAQDAPSASDQNFYQAFSQWCDEYFFLPHRNETRGVGGIFYDYLGLNRLGAARERITPGQFGRGGVGKEHTAHGMEVAANAALDWRQCFDFTRAVGEAFLAAYPAIIERRMHEPFTDADRAHQLFRRGRYAEYNLLYDRGTRFGLMTGGNPDAILMSLPPIATWK